MYRKFSQYPIGAMWKATTKEGVVGKIELIKRQSSFEVWRWSVDKHPYSYGPETDWCMTKNAARIEIPLFNLDKSKITMKRIN